MRLRRYLVWLAAILGAWPVIRAQAAELEVREHVLPNGFRLLVVEDHRVPRVAASLWYRLGALQESHGEHGSTHFLEHAVFQGTTSVGTRDLGKELPILREIYDAEQELIAVRNRERNRLRERDVFAEPLAWPVTPEEEALRRKLYQLEDQDSQHRDFWAEYNWYRRYGALARHTDPVPATTGSEHLEIDIDLPRENLELFFRQEADRMVNAVLRGWEAQRFTVLEQVLNRYSRPEAADFLDALDAITGSAHPLFQAGGGWGHRRDFASFNRAAMLRMYDAYFVPNNATLALVGDIRLEEARVLADRYFGAVPRGAEPPARMDVEAEPVPQAAVRLDWREPMPPRLILRFRIPGVGHPDRPLFDVIAALLRGRHGLLGARLDGLEAQASASRAGSIGTLTVTLPAGRDEDLPGMERTALDTLEELRRGKIEPRALERVQKQLRLARLRTVSNRSDLAYELGSFQIMDDWKTLRSHLEARESASVEDVQRVARQHLGPENRVIATTRLKP
jgi:predicted Zn-dependent peptidase